MRSPGKNSAFTPVFDAFHDVPPSSVTYTPPVDSAASTREGSEGWGRIVWKACPPKPAFHSGRCGWSQRPRTSENVSPRSSERKTAPGSVPAQTTPSPPSAEVPGCSCHTRASVVSVSSGKRAAPFGVSSHVAPRSSERQTCGPSQLDEAPASRRGVLPRVSTMTE